MLPSFRISLYWPITYLLPVHSFLYWPIAEIARLPCPPTVVLCPAGLASSQGTSYPLGGYPTWSSSTVPPKSLQTCNQKENAVNFWKYPGNCESKHNDQELLACYCNRFWTLCCSPGLGPAHFCCSKGLCIWRSIKRKKSRNSWQDPKKIKELLTRSKRKLSNGKWSESHRCDWRNQMDKPPADTSVWTDTAPSPAASSPSGTSAGIPTTHRNPSASAKF